MARHTEEYAENPKLEIRKFKMPDALTALRPDSGFSERNVRIPLRIQVEGH